jgi:uncharacterized membrane protein
MSLQDQPLYISGFDTSGVIANSSSLSIDTNETNNTILLFLLVKFVTNSLIGMQVISLIGKQEYLQTHVRSV